MVEREWLQAGYPFQKRHSKCCYSNSRNKNQQPTFLLFLDCVQQLHYQFPCSFEFTTHMLILLFEHSYFSQFGKYVNCAMLETCINLQHILMQLFHALGTFLGNCEADREKLNVSKKTTSLWSYLNRPDILTSLLNPLYDPNKMAIWPSVAPVSLVLWDELYLRWVIDQSQQKKAMNKIQSLIQNDKDARSKVLKLRKQLVDLQREYDVILSLEEAIEDDTETG